MKTIFRVLILFLCMLVPINVGYYYQGGGVSLAETQKPLGTNGRTKATGAVVYTVAKSGNDNNDCKSFATACLTMNGALLKVMNNNDLAGNQVYIQPTASTGNPQTWTENLVISGPTFGGQGNFEGAGELVISGQAGGVTLSSSNSKPVILIENGANVVVQGVKITSTSTGSGILVQSESFANINNVTFGNVGGTMTDVSGNSTLQSGAGVVISGNAISFLHANSLGYANLDSQTITCTGSPVMSSYFLGMSGSSYVESIGTSFSGCGSVTGSKFTLNRNATVRTDTNNLNFFPGNIAGTISSGAMFDDFGTSGNGLRTISTGTTDNTAGQGGNILLWNSATVGAKSEVLPVCGNTGPWQPFTVTDAIGTALVNNIIITASGTTFNGSTSYIIASTNGSVTLQCDGVSNYIALHKF